MEVKGQHRGRKVRRCEEKAVKGDLNIVGASRSFLFFLFIGTRFPSLVDFTRWGVTGNYLLLSNLGGSARHQVTCDSD